MASYDNLLAMDQPWMNMRSEILNPWINISDAADAMAKPTSTYSYTSFATNCSSYAFPSDELLESIFATPSPAVPVVAEENFASVESPKELVLKPPRRRSAPLAPAAVQSGRIAKRKSRAKKRSATTTFITADPANFRRMVQQVTGAKFGGGTEEVPAEAWKAVELNSILPPGGGLTTLDTSSAFLIDGSASSLASQHSVDGGAGGAEHYADSFCSFPTLESWKAT